MTSDKDATLRDGTLLGRIADYWDSRAEGYALQVDEEMRQALEQQYLPRFADLPAGARVLDAGCGPGFFSVMLARAGFSVTALDASAEMLGRTRSRAAAHSVAVETVRGDAEALPFDDASFDCVCSRNLLWNLLHPETALREWLRVLKPGGVLLVFDGNHYRYLFDERYARVHEDWMKSSNHRMLGVDPKTIDSIAADLPLGKVLRPQWDVGTLSALGVRVESTVLKTCTDPATGEELAADFVVRAEKPL